jgi:hypothetical protein
MDMFDVPDAGGFEADPVVLPSERDDVLLGRRRHAALLVLAIGRGATPEDLMDDVTPEVVEAFGDDLELAEAMTHVDLLLDVLIPREAVGR